MVWIRICGLKMSFERKSSGFMGVSKFYILKHFSQLFLNVYNILYESVIYLKIVAEFVPERQSQFF